MEGWKKSMEIKFFLQLWNRLYQSQSYVSFKKNFFKIFKSLFTQAQTRRLQGFPLFTNWLVWQMLWCHVQPPWLYTEHGQRDTEDSKLVGYVQLPFLPRGIQMAKSTITNWQVQKSSILHHGAFCHGWQANIYCFRKWLPILSTFFVDK